MKIQHEDKPGAVFVLRYLWLLCTRAAVLRYMILSRLSFLQSYLSTFVCPVVLNQLNSSLTWSCRNEATVYSKSAHVVTSCYWNWSWNMWEGGALFTVRQFVISFEAIQPSLIMQRLSNMVYFPKSIIFLSQLFIYST